MCFLMYGLTQADARGAVFKSPVRSCGRAPGSAAGEAASGSFKSTGKS